jgi:GNAT superfamily N-acetyltransferase
VRPDLQIIRGGAERIADLEPLYRELHTHHVAVAPRLAGLPPRTAAESWTCRRARYEEWLAAPDAFVLVAEQRGQPIGFVLVTTVVGYQAWASADRVGEVHDLVVARPSRAAGVGTALMDAVESQLAWLGIREYRVTAITANEDALRFYESRGMTLVSHVLLGHIDAG